MKPRCTAAGLLNLTMRLLVPIAGLRIYQEVRVVSVRALVSVRMRLRVVPL